ncbi:MAG: hypothetical protein GY752_10310 [bacterium]|nr:hypothetical protein [bacterium]
MAFDKLVDTLNGFRKAYTNALGKSIKDNHLVATGRLNTSVSLPKQPKVKVFGGIYNMAITMEDYGLDLDEGTKPQGKRPNRFTMSENYGDIYDWLSIPTIKDKIGNFKGSSDTAKWSQSKHEGLAFVISRNLQNYGLRPRNWIDPFIDPINRSVPSEIEEAIADDVALTMEQLKKFIESQG